jgi:hypothetical protein
MKVLILEIDECPWADRMLFRMREGDIAGSIESSNLTAEELIETIKMMIVERMNCSWETIVKKGKLKSKKSGRSKMKTEGEFCRTTAFLLRHAFDWNKTKQGAEYWLSVYENLLEIAKGKAKKEDKT